MALITAALFFFVTHHYGAPSGAKGMFKKMTGGLKGVENIYTQHTPLLQQTLDQLAKGKLKEPAFPFVDKQYRDKPQDIIVFMVGGTTYVTCRLFRGFF